MTGRDAPQFISEAAARGNAAALDFCRTSGAALAGVTAGVLGLTGWHGLALYLSTWAILSLLLASRAGRAVRSRRALLTGGLVGGLFTYVLFWTFLYGMVHVY
uniref:ER membrane protein complex subunit 6-like n=1 Tax=Myxine glutinosa TaxID=7769 RepID=UPI0035900C63